MRCAALQSAGLTLVVLAAPVAAPSQAQPVLVLLGPTVSFDLQAQGLAWVDANAEASVEPVAPIQFRAAISPPCSNTIYTLGTRAALWPHYRFQDNGVMLSASRYKELAAGSMAG